jgi:hypothetical protein
MVRTTSAESAFGEDTLVLASSKLLRHREGSARQVHQLRIEMMAP